jgi:hypothetical protein
MTLRHRFWAVTVGTSQVSSEDVTVAECPLTVKFDISKSLDREPNKASIQLCNLSPSRRNELEQADASQVQIVAGYRESAQHDTIFTGDARDIYSQREEANIWTHIESEDGGTAYRTATITATFDEGVSLATVIRGCVRALGIGEGNLTAVATAAQLDAGGAIFPDGLALEGPAWRALDMICRSSSLRWSVQNGVLQLRRAARPAHTRAVLLNPSSGLIGSPTRSSRDPRTGKITVEARSLIMPGLYPGRVVVLDTDTIEGNWLCQSVRYTGDSTGNEWYAELTLKDYPS